MSNTTTKAELYKTTNKISALFYQNLNSYGRIECIAETCLNMEFKFQQNKCDHDHYSTYLTFDYKSLQFSGKFTYWSKLSEFTNGSLEFKDLTELNNLKHNDIFPKPVLDMLRTHIINFNEKSTDGKPI